MLAHVLGRTGQMVLVVVGVVTIVFFALRLAAGDPARLMTQPGTPETIVQEVRERIGTDKPLHAQYANYVADLARRDLGTSFHGGQPVRDAVLRALPNTLALAAATMVVASILGLAL
ncbi:MAG: glutathione ABC transporter permease GsiC, partial [Actinomycetota bacterium]